jgi:hypothetical protein
MDDVLVPLALAFAAAVLVLMVQGGVSAAVRHFHLRDRDGETAVRE